MLMSIRSQLVAFALVLPLGACTGGPGEPCDEENRCAAGLRCFEGLCSGTGTARSGDQCYAHNECMPGTVCFGNTLCIGVGALRMSLTWDDETDVDLHVVAPNGVEIFFGNTMGAGGLLDVDDCIGGNCFDPFGEHIENIVFDEPQVGTYTVFANNFSCLYPVDYTIEVVNAGVPEAVFEELLPACGNGTHFTYELM